GTTSGDPPAASNTYTVLLSELCLEPTLVPATAIRRPSGDQLPTGATPSTLDVSSVRAPSKEITSAVNCSWYSPANVAVFRATATCAPSGEISDESFLDAMPIRLALPEFGFTYASSDHQGRCGRAITGGPTDAALCDCEALILASGRFALKMCTAAPAYC